MKVYGKLYRDFPPLCNANPDMKWGNRQHGRAGFAEYVVGAKVSPIRFKKKQLCEKLKAAI